MKTFKFCAVVSISISTDVEAETEAEARAIAEDRAMVSLCHQCATGNISEEWVTSGELDGEPRRIQLEDREQ